MEHEHARQGTRTYTAAWDMHRAKLFCLCVSRSRLEYLSVWSPGRWLSRTTTLRNGCSGSIDNASIYHGQPCVERFQRQWPSTQVVHTPVNARRPNQVELYFSIEQRNRQNGKCYYCLAPLRDATIEHIQPLQPRQGLPGSSNPDNLVLACRSCNSAKGNRSIVTMRRPNGQQFLF